MDVNRLSQGEKIAGIGAILLFISMFFAWFGFDTGLGELESRFGIDAGPSSVTFSAWESFDFIDLVLLLTVIVACATVALRAADMAVDFPLNTAVAVLGGLATLLVLYRIINTPGDPGPDREWGIFLGLVLSALVAFGGYRAMQEEGVTFSDAADRLSGGPGHGDGPGGSPPPPPSSTTPPPPPPPSPGV